MPRIRTFIAVELPSSVKARAKDLIGKFSTTGATIAWVKPEQMHLTMQFLGDVPDRDTPDICRVVSRVAGQFEPFEIICRGAGAFPSPEHPRTLWIGIEDGAEELCRLQGEIEAALHDELGYARERRRFQPHLTIGRVKHEPPESRGSLAQLLAEHATFDADLAIVDEVVVFASFLDRAGPTHEALGRGELRG
jgi:2'-5' RNA ligase